KSALVDVHVSATITPIGEVKVGRSDPYGNEIAREFQHEGNVVYLTNEGYKAMRRIVQAIQRTPDFKDSVSIDVLLDLTFEWLTARYRKETTATLTAFLIPECEKLVEEVEIWIPIAHTRCQSELPFGNVTFKTITRAMLDQYEEEIRKQLS